MSPSSEEPGADLRAELARARAEIDRLRNELAARVGNQEMEEATGLDGTLFISEVEVRRAIARQLQNAARLLQAGKCLYLLYDALGELIAQRPALGLDEDDLGRYRVKVNQGFSGEVFRTRKAVRSNDLGSDPRAGEEPVEQVGARNGICVPLLVQIRDEENRVIDSKPIGVLWVMNRRREGEFSDDDERLLTVFARQVAAVVSNAQIFREMLHENKALVSTFENLPAGILFIGHDERIRLINGPARQLFGVPDTQGIGDAYYRTVEHQATCDVLGAALREDEDKVSEVPFEVDEEERVFQIQAARVRDQDEALDGVVAIFNDVTEIHRVDRMKQEFVQTFSTELLGPLASIQGFASMLQKSSGEFPARFHAEVNEVVTDECRRLRRHIQDLLNVSRFEHGIKLHLNLSKIDLVGLVKRVAAPLSGSRDRHELVLEVDDGLPEVTGDEARLEEVIDNLITNAFKYSPDGGEVTVRAKRVEAGVRFEVSDEGVGIAEENHETVFQKFARVAQQDERLRAGRGIGLFISRVFVEAHGGRIGLDSEVDHGSTFWFEVPLQPPTESDGEAEDESK